VYLDLTLVKDWLVPVSTFIALITTSIAGWLSLREYRLKVQSETRLQNSSEIEADVKLLKLFSEIMNIAHARGQTELSEVLVEKFLSPEIMKELGVTAVNLDKVLDRAVISHPVGVASQDAAIAAIWALGCKHEVLQPVALQALMTLSEFKKNTVKAYLDDLSSKAKVKVLAS
jgi:hypothetical protein